jgi:hypothetical protein
MTLVFVGRSNVSGVTGVTVLCRPDVRWTPFFTDPIVLLSTRSPPGDDERRLGRKRRIASPWLGALGVTPWS